MKQLITSLILYAIASTALAHNVVMYDAENTKIGPLDGDHDSWLMVMTYDGYLMFIEPSDGTLFSAGSALYYESNDCSGQGYVIPVTNQAIDSRGGMIFQYMQSTNLNLNFVKVEWTPVSKTVSTKSMKTGMDPTCLSSTGDLYRGVPVSPVNPSDYGIKLRNDNTWGFVLPFHSVVVQSEVIYCNGFESCTP